MKADEGYGPKNLQMRPGASTHKHDVSRQPFLPEKHQMFPQFDHINFEVRSSGLKDFLHPLRPSHQACR